MKIKFNNFKNNDTVLERTLLPAQEKFWNSEKTYSILNGGFGSGKTEIMLLKVIYDCLSQPDNYFLLGRKTYTEIYDVLLKDFMDYVILLGLRVLRRPPTLQLNYIHRENHQQLYLETLTN